MMREEVGRKKKIKRRRGEQKKTLRPFKNASNEQNKEKTQTNDWYLCSIHIGSPNTCWRHRLNLFFLLLLLLLLFFFISITPSIPVLLILSCIQRKLSIKSNAKKKKPNGGILLLNQKKKTKTKQMVENFLEVI